MPWPRWPCEVMKTKQPSPATRPQRGDAIEDQAGRGRFARRVEGPGAGAETEMSPAGTPIPSQPAVDRLDRVVEHRLGVVAGDQHRLPSRRPGRRDPAPASSAKAHRQTNRRGIARGIAGFIVR